MPPHPQLARTEHLPDDPDADAPLVVLVHGSLDRAGSFQPAVFQLRPSGEVQTVIFPPAGAFRTATYP